MAIDAVCPFCAKAYRLKDDLLGKKVTCANGDCRKLFLVIAVPPAVKAAAAVAVPQPPAPVIDADAFAASAFADDPNEAVPEDKRTIAMTCTVCEHKWTMAWAMQGKNSLCPDCKTRQKVPEQKKAGKADWRDGSGRPSMAKIEELEGVQASNNARVVSGTAMKEAGLLEPQYEARSLGFYLKIGAAVAAVLAVVVGGVVISMKSRTDRKQTELFDEFVKAADSDEMKALPPAAGPLYRAALLMAAAEYEGRVGDAKALDKAARYYHEARGELEKAPRAPDRDALLAELAVGVIGLGGDADEVKLKFRLPWVPIPPAGNSRATLKPSQAEAEGVQGLLRRALEALRQEKQPVEFDVRAAAVRRITRLLARANQTQMLLDTLQAGFFDGEQPEIKGQIGLELIRLGQPDKAREIAEGLKATLTAAGAPPPTPVPASAQALWLALDPPILGTPTLVPPPPAAGEVLEPARLAYVALKMVQNKPDETRDLAARPGKPDGRIRAFALAAEWADQPGPFVDAAAELVAAELQKKDGPPPPQSSISRLALAAARANMLDPAGKLADALFDEGLREWTRAEILRVRLAANPGAAAPDDDAPVPADSKKYRLGHARGRLILARHNAARTNDRGLAKTYAAAWPTNTLAPFGQAGVALGTQDNERKK